MCSQGEKIATFSYRFASRWVVSSTHRKNNGTSIINAIVDKHSNTCGSKLLSIEMDIQSQM